ncbi:MAG: hypothetical protein GXO79_06700 [Chlorobi bacterium]|nr:hypothetical protein [Chlorobiota bacterium]
MSIKQITLDKTSIEDLFTNDNLIKIEKKGYIEVELKNKLYLVFLKWGVNITSSFNLDNYLIVDNSNTATNPIFGGSVCESKLEYTGRHWTISKQFQNNSELEKTDSIERHIIEAEWLTSKEIKKTGLFPQCNYQHKNDKFKLSSEFIPSNTLGEVIWDGKYSVKKIADFIGDIFSKLNSSIYLDPSDQKGECYIEKVQRRWENLITKDTNKIWSELYTNSSIINGKRYASLNQILANIEKKSKHISLNNNSNPRMCHGDLIPEDILVNSTLTKFILIDPNPQNSDPLCDWSKMIMSIFLYYELAIQDKIFVQNITLGDKVSFNYTYSSCSLNHRNFMNKLFTELLSDDSIYLKQLRLYNTNIEIDQILLNAGLMAIAIVPFHMLEHKNLFRSLYFYSKGIELINSVL